MTPRLWAAMTIRHRSRLIGIWLVPAAGFSPLAAQLPQALGDHGLETHGQYAEVQELLARELRIPEEPVIVLFHNPGGLPRSSFRAYITAAMNRISRVGGTAVAASPLDRPEMMQADYAYAELTVLPGAADDKRLALERVEGALALADEDGFKAELTGKPVVQRDVNLLSRTDLRAAETVGLPIAFALLAFALGGLLPALIPIVAGGITVIVSMGLMYLIGAYSSLSLSVFVHNVIPMVGMAVCIDFALLMVGRFREERRRNDAEVAIRTTMITSGRAVTASAGCVALALIGTLFIRMPIFNTVALGTLVVIAVSLLVNLTFVPASLYALRDRLPSGPKPVLDAGVWKAFPLAVLRRPAVSAALAAGVLLVCMYPMSGLEVGVPGPRSLPSDQESRQAAETVALRFHPPSASLAWLALKEGPGGEQAAESLRLDLMRDPQVVQAKQEFKPLSGEGYRFIAVWLLGEESSKEAMGWVRERERLYDGIGVLVGGEPKYHQEVRDEVFGRMKFVLLFVALSNFLVLAAAFRSLLIPVKAIAMNLVSIAASFGILAWLFQGGRFGLEATEIAIMIPVFVFGLTFGISMDYGIFLLSRISESYGETRDNERAIREGMAASGKIITAAAAIMIAVTAPFALAGVSGVRQLGIGIAAALFLDATIVRMVLVPALMKCFGKWNWWLPFARS